MVLEFVTVSFQMYLKLLFFAIRQGNVEANSVL